MKCICKQLLLTGLFLFIVLAGTISIAADKNALINDLYYRSGLEMQVDWMRNNFADARALLGDDAKQEDAATREMIALLDQSLKEKFSDRRVRGMVLSHLDRNLSEQQLEQILRIMDDPVWQRAWELEKRACQPDGIARMQQYMSSNYIRLYSSPVMRRLSSTVTDALLSTRHLDNKSPRNSRVNLVGKLIDVTNAVDLTLEMAIQGALMASRIMADKLNKTEITEKQMEAAARQHMENYREQYRDMLTAQTLYIYRYMSDSQLETYIRLYSSPVMRRLSSTVTDALLSIMR